MDRGATLTKDNMLKRNWNGDPKCRFCDSLETTEHLFFQCPTARVVWGITAQCLGASTIPCNIRQYWNWIAKYLPNGNNVYTFGLAAICWATWKARNVACFENKLIKHPAEIICHACSLMFYWTGLYKPEFQIQIAEGVKVLLSMACRILANQPRAAPQPRALLPAPEADEDEEEVDQDLAA